MTARAPEFLTAPEAARLVRYDVPEHPGPNDRGMRSFYAWVKRTPLLRARTHRRGRRLLFRREDLIEALGPDETSEAWLDDAARRAARGEPIPRATPRRRIR